MRRPVVKKVGASGSLAERMSWETRMSNYTGRVPGSLDLLPDVAKLTPRQRRRLVHKNPGACALLRGAPTC